MNITDLTAKKAKKISNRRKDIDKQTSLILGMVSKAAHKGDVSTLVYDLKGSDFLLDELRNRGFKINIEDSNAETLTLWIGWDHA